MSSTTTSFGGYFPQYSGLQVNGLADTSSASPSGGDTLVYDSDSSKWVNQAAQNTTTVTTDTTAGDETYSAAEMLGGLILRDPNGAGRSDTTDTAANIVAAFPNAIVGSSFQFTVRNTADAAETITLGGGTGVTTSGTMTIGQNNSKTFLVRLDNVTSSSEACTIYSLGTSVH
jgi:hypothetical protein